MNMKRLWRVLLVGAALIAGIGGFGLAYVLSDGALFVNLFATRTRLRALDPSSPAAPYVPEFLESEARYPHETRAPTGIGDIVVDTHGGPVFFSSCHTLWLQRSDLEAQRIVTAREADPGSGLSFGIEWSKDSKAVFVSGPHSGIDCPWSRAYGDLRIIYTLVDDVAWELPGENPHGDR